MQDNGAAPEIDESFESVYRGLEETVGRLEAGGLTLEESIQLYESGMRLARRCKEMLDAAELRVSRLEEELGSGDARIGEDPADWSYGSDR
jgi:exodeoxyribonuclease VII small subunit